MDFSLYQETVDSEAQQMADFETTAEDIGVRHCASLKTALFGGLEGCTMPAMSSKKTLRSFWQRILPHEPRPHQS
jgi:hypothetical protein